MSKNKVMFPVLAEKVKYAHYMTEKAQRSTNVALAYCAQLKEINGRLFSRTTQGGNK